MNHKRTYCYLIAAFGVIYLTLFYKTFFHFSNWIWSLNAPYSKNDFADQVVGFYSERDGIEGYVLYAGILSCMVLTLITAKFFTHKVNKLVLIGLTSFCFIIWATQIGFHPPIELKIYPLLTYKWPFCFLIGTLVLLNWTHEYRPQLTLVLLIAILIPLCFISCQKISLFDYNFIFGPALRIHQGYALSDTYFQYDLLLSLLASIWMKFNWDINTFQITGEAATFLFFILSFLFGRSFFKQKKILIFFIVMLIIVRYLILFSEMSSYLQTTPLRLDLWIIPLFLINRRKLSHYSVGIALAVLYVVHRNFGLIYVITYLMTLCFSIYNQVYCNKKELKLALKDYLPNGIILLAGFIISAIIFNGIQPESAILYQSIGIGMIKISAQSFYWYIGLLLIVTVGIIWINFRSGPQSEDRIYYWQTGMFIILVCLGNSLYFFGRSHENNILNCSGAIVFTLFLALDNLSREIWKPFILVALIWVTVVGAERIEFKLYRKAIAIFENHKIIEPLPELDTRADLNSINNLTGYSKKVYVLDFYKNFILTYNGNYPCVGYFQPSAAWVLKKEQQLFLQSLLDQDFYIVWEKSSNMDHIIQNLHYKKMMSKENYIAIH